MFSFYKKIETVFFLWNKECSQILSFVSEFLPSQNFRNAKFQRIKVGNTVPPGHRT